MFICAEGRVPKFLILNNFTQVGTEFPKSIFELIPTFLVGWLMRDGWKTAVDGHVITREIPSNNRDGCSTEAEKAVVSIAVLERVCIQERRELLLSLV